MTTPRLPCLWTALILIACGAACDDPKGPVAPLPPAPAPPSRSLTGYIRAADTGGPLVAHINASTNRAPSESQVTDESGRFTFADVGAIVYVSVSAAGFASISTGFAVAGDVTRDFLLTPYEPAALNLAGGWTMSLSASRSCRTKLPSIARERKYTASIQQESSQLRIALASPTLRWRDGPEGTFNAVGSLSGARVDFHIPTASEEIDTTTELDVTDEIGPGQALGIVGSVSGPATGGEVTATMSGFLIYRDRNLGTTAVCDALDHQVIFKR